MIARRIGLNLAATVYDKLLVAGVQLALVPLLVMHWGVPVFGSWVLLSAVPAMLALGDFGFGGAAFVRMTALVARGQRDAAVVVLHTARQVVLFVGALLLAVASAAIWSIPDAWLPRTVGLGAGDARAVLQLLLIYALVVLQGTLQASSFASVRLFALSYFVNAHVILLENVLLAGAVLLGHGPVAAAAAMLTGRLVGTAGQALLLRWRVPWLTFGIARADPAERRVLARSAASMVAVPAAQSLALQGTVIVLGAAAGGAAVPAFAAARTLSRIGLQATQLLTQALIPEFAVARAEDNRRGQAAMLLAVLGLTTTLALPFAMVLAIAGDWLLRLWTGGALAVPAGLMPVVALSVVFAALWQPLSNLMMAIDRQAAFAWAYLTLGPISLAITYAGARLLGGTGAAIGAAALDAAMMVVVGRFAWRHWLRGLPVGEVAQTAFRRLRP